MNASRGDVRRGIAGALAAALLVAAPQARADRTQACIDASLQGQKLRDRSELRAARGEFLSCAKADCPAIVRTSCIEWASDVEARLPSVVLHAQDASGADIADIDVTLDGAPFASLLDGKPVGADPGSHAFRFVHRRTRESLSVAVVLAEGEKRRLLRVRFAAATPDVDLPPAPPSAPATASERSAVLRPLPLALGGLSLAGFAAFAALGLHASSRLDQLRATCAPTCEQSALDSVRREALVADLGLGVGLASLAAATWVVLATRTPSSAVTAAPAPGGAVVSFARRF